MSLPHHGARRVLLLALAVGAVLVARPLALKWPVDQTVHYVVDESRGPVVKLDAHWSEPGGAVLREVSLRNLRGRGPNSSELTDRFRLPSGPYDVDVDVETEAGSSRTFHRSVRLEGGECSVELALPRETRPSNTR